MPSLLLIFPGAGMPCGQANSGVGNEAPQQVMWNRQRWGPRGLDTVLETQQSFSGFSKNWSQSKGQVFLEDRKSQMPGPNLSWGLSWRALNLGPQAKGASQRVSDVFCDLCSLPGRGSTYPQMEEEAGWEWEKMYCKYSENLLCILILALVLSQITLVNIMLLIPKMETLYSPPGSLFQQKIHALTNDQ